MLFAVRAIGREADSLGNRLPPAGLKLNAQHASFGDNFEVVPPNDRLEILPVSVCTDSPLLADLELPKALLCQTSRALSSKSLSYGTAPTRPASHWLSNQPLQGVFRVWILYCLSLSRSITTFTQLWAKQFQMTCQQTFQLTLRAEQITHQNTD